MKPAIPPPLPPERRGRSALWRGLRLFLIIGAIGAAVVVGAGLYYAYSSGAFIRACDVHVSQPEAAVQDARQIINAFRQSNSEKEKSRFINIRDLSPSLRIPRLRYAVVFPDHINLILGRNPDWEIGARIWSKGTAQHDKSTAYHDIFFFEYCNDLPTGDTNRI